MIGFQSGLYTSEIFMGNDKALPYIVTAFMDIGRGDWTTDRIENGVHLPHYLKRGVENYMSHFRVLAHMKNPLVVFVPDNLRETVGAICKAVGRHPNSYEILPLAIDEKLYAQIRIVIKSPEFVESINPYQKGNPEYWSQDYVYVTSRKARFVDVAYFVGAVPKDRNAAWVDFGYCRTMDHLPKSREWNPAFDFDKINLFVYKEPPIEGSRQKTLEIAVKNNIVYIIGGVFLTNRQGWFTLAEYMDNNLYNLMRNNLVDDDQGLLLGSYLYKPELFKLHQLPPQKNIEDVRSIFRVFE